MQIDLIEVRHDIIPGVYLNQNLCWYYEGLFIILAFPIFRPYMVVVNSRFL